MYTTIRLVSFLMMFLLIKVTTVDYFIFVTSILGLGHYAIALLYSKGSAVSFYKAPFAFWRGSFLLLLSLALIETRFIPMTLYFGVHHLFSETYTHQSHFKYKGDKIGVFFTFVFYTSLYLLFCLNEPFVRQIPRGVIVWSFILSAPWHLYFLSSKKDLKEKKDIFWSEFILIPIGLVCLFYKFHVFHIIFYHFAFWIFFPLTKLHTEKLNSKLKYFAQTIFITGGIFLLYHYQVFDPTKSYGHLYVLGYLHITVSLGLSRLNPFPIRKYLVGEGLTNIS